MKIVKLTDDILVNVDNITYFNWEMVSSDGYVWKNTWRLYIHFVGVESTLKLKTQDKNLFDSWLEALTKEELK